MSFWESGRGKGISHRVIAVLRTAWLRNPVNHRIPRRPEQAEPLAAAGRTAETPPVQMSAADLQSAYPADPQDTHRAGAPARYTAHMKAPEARAGNGVSGPDDPWGPYGPGGAYCNPAHDRYASGGGGRAADPEGDGGEHEVCGTCRGEGTVCSCGDRHCLVGWYDPDHVPDPCTDCDGLSVRWREAFHEAGDAAAGADRPDTEIELY
jgi:hypothetical protein